VAVSGHFVEVCEIHGTRYGSCRCIGPHEQRKVPCRPARCNVTRLPPPAVSAEPRVLLEFEADGSLFRMTQDAGQEKPWVSRKVSECPFDLSEHWCPEMADSKVLCIARAVYDAMRAREVRE